MGEETDFRDRRRISRQQMEVLVQYMERYPALALSTARSRDAVIESKRMWDKIARTLNRIDKSQPKSGTSWSKYWADVKCKIRRKYTMQQKNYLSVHLSPLQERLVKILTDEEGILLCMNSLGSAHRHTSQNPSKELQKTHINKYNNNSETTEDIEEIKVHSEYTKEVYLSPTYPEPPLEPRPEKIIIPDTCDRKPILNTIKNIIDPIKIAEEIQTQKSIDELKRELIEFELRRQKELFEIQKQQLIEKHELEMSILRVKKLVVMKDLEKS